MNFNKGDIVYGSDTSVEVAKGNGVYFEYISYDAERKRHNTRFLDDGNRISWKYVVQVYPIKSHINELVVEAESLVSGAPVMMSNFSYEGAFDNYEQCPNYFYIGRDLDGKHIVEHRRDGESKLERWKYILPRHEKRIFVKPVYALIRELESHGYIFYPDSDGVSPFFKDPSTGAEFYTHMFKSCGSLYGDVPSHESHRYYDWMMETR